MRFAEFVDILEGNRDPKYPNGVYYIQKQNSNFTTKEYSTLAQDAERHIPWASEAFGTCYMYNPYPEFIYTCKPMVYLTVVIVCSLRTFDWRQCKLKYFLAGRNVFGQVATTIYLCICVEKYPVSRDLVGRDLVWLAAMCRFAKQLFPVCREDAGCCQFLDGRQTSRYFESVSMRNVEAVRLGTHPCVFVWCNSAQGFLWEHLLRCQGKQNVHLATTNRSSVCSSWYAVDSHQTKGRQSWILTDPCLHVLSEILLTHFL